MYCIVRPMVPVNNVQCTYHCLHVWSILVSIGCIVKAGSGPPLNINAMHNYLCSTSLTICFCQLINKGVRGVLCKDSGRESWHPNFIGPVFQYPKSFASLKSESCPLQNTWSVSNLNPKSLHMPLTGP